MGLKITSGAFKGRKLQGPKNADIRPATAMVRKSVFEILGPMEGKIILDLFAGTGSVGLEALSRGASSAVFVDPSQVAFSLLFENLKKLNLLDKAHILKQRASTAIKILCRKKLKFDFIFVDPPYDKGFVDKTLECLTTYPLLAPEGMIITEHSPRERPTFFVGLRKVSERKYGQTILTFLREA